MRAAALVVAGAGLLGAVPASPIFDAWSWLGWGRQLRHGGLDVAGPTSWKPFTALVALVLSPLGDGAAAAWLLLVRGAAIATLVAVGVAARRLSTRPRLAAATAVVSTVALRHVVPAALEGAGETVLCALLAGAAAIGLPVLLAVGPGGSTGRRRTRGDLAAALVLVGGTIRPEVWPLACAVTAATVWRRPTPVRLAGLAGAVGMVGCWFLPIAGAAAGQARSSPLVARTGPASLVVDALTVAPVAALALAAVAVTVALTDGRSRRAHGGDAVLVLAAAALSIVGVAALEGLAGYPAPARFVLPAGPVVAVLAAAGLDPLLARTARPVSVALLALLAFEVLVPRAVSATRETRAVRERADRAADVRSVVAAAGPASLHGGQLCVTRDDQRSEVAFLTWRPVSSICSPDGFASTRRSVADPAAIIDCAGLRPARTRVRVTAGACALYDEPGGPD